MTWQRLWQESEMIPCFDERFFDKQIHYKCSKEYH